MCPPDDPSSADLTTQTAGPSGPSCPSAPATPGAILAEALLGDFRIVREVGRGGMGIVYEAVQISLGRRVALKVLPDAFGLDGRRLQRFKNEAHAAACLHHTNIVPVYGTGSENGTHYYAMQFVEGNTLADVLDELRRSIDPAATVGPLTLAEGGPETIQVARLRVSTMPGRPSPLTAEHVRRVARIGAQAAEALQHAHEQGVLHRDIKPANLMVEANGHLWVTDFGLAQFQGDPGLTATGDLIGTLRYMSPEQALAKRVPVDHRTDVYSLGATLYELFTLQPAVAGADRAELLRNIAFEEPVAPRKLNATLPRDPETILLKALAKAPADRYATAQELADDLRRFLEDKPIQARRPTLGQRLGRWARRHRALAGAAVIVLVLAVVGLALTTGLVWREKEKTQIERDNFEQEKFRAEREKERARAEAKSAQEQRQRAEDLLDLGLATLDAMYLDVAAERMPRAARPSPEDERLLKQALAFYEAFVQRAGDNPRVRAKVGLAHYRVADIRRSLGQYPEAEKSARAAIAIFRDLADHFGDAAHQEHLGQAYMALGIALDLAGQDAKAEEAHRQCLTIQRALAAKFSDQPRYRGDEGSTLHNLAMLRANRRDWKGTKQLVEQAIVAQKVALKSAPLHPTYCRHLLNHFHLLGNALIHLGRAAEAETCQAQALRLAGWLMAADGSWQAREALGRSHANLAGVLRTRGALLPAIEHLRLALALRAALLAEYPRLANLRADLAVNNYGLARFLQEKGERDEARECLRRSVALWGDLVREFPTVPTYRNNHAEIRDAQVEFLEKEGRFAQAEQARRDDVALAEKLLKTAPRAPENRLLLAQRLNALASHLGNIRGQPQRAVPQLERALPILRDLRAEFPREQNYAEWLAVACQNCGLSLRDIGRLDDAVKVLDEACGTYRTLLRQPGASPALRPRLAWALTERGLVLTAQGRLDEAERSHREGLMLQEAVVKARRPAPAELRDLAGILNNLANVLREQKKFGEARRLLERAIEHQKAALLATPNDQRALNFFRSHHVALADVLDELEQYAEAAALMGRLAQALEGRVEAFGDQRAYWRGMGRTHQERGAYLGRAKKFAEAEIALRQALGLQRRVTSPGPEDRTALGITLYLLGQALKQQKKGVEACSYLEQAIKEFSAAWKDQPAQAAHPARIVRSHRVLASLRLEQRDATAASRSAEALVRLATTDWEATFFAARVLVRCRELVVKKDAKQARTYAEGAEKARAEAVRRCRAPDDHNGLAWELATAKEEELRDPAEAVRQARKAVKLAPDNGGYWNTLGVAHYRAGEWQKALVALERSMVLREWGNPYDWLFVALALERLGKKDEARCWYGRSVGWLEEHGRNEELERFRAEADAVFGRAK